MMISVSWRIQKGRHGCQCCLLCSPFTSWQDLTMHALASVCRSPYFHGSIAFARTGREVHWNGLIFLRMNQFSQERLPSSTGIKSEKLPKFAHNHKVPKRNMKYSLTSKTIAGKLAFLAVWWIAVDHCHAVTAPTSRSGDGAHRILTPNLRKATNTKPQNGKRTPQTPPVTSAPSPLPTSIPSQTPSNSPIGVPSMFPTSTLIPDQFPMWTPTLDISSSPTAQTLPPSSEPTLSQSQAPSTVPSVVPSLPPSLAPSVTPTLNPSQIPSNIPSESPSLLPSSVPSLSPTWYPSQYPSSFPSLAPSSLPSSAPSQYPTPTPTPDHVRGDIDSPSQSILPSLSPTQHPSSFPTATLILSPTSDYTPYPTYGMVFPPSPGFPSPSTTWPSQAPSSSVAPTSTRTPEPSSLLSSSQSPTFSPSQGPSSESAEMKLSLTADFCDMPDLGELGCEFVHWVSEVSLMTCLDISEVGKAVTFGMGTFLFWLADSLPFPDDFEVKVWANGLVDDLGDALEPDITISLVSISSGEHTWEWDPAIDITAEQVCVGLYSETAGVKYNGTVDDAMGDNSFAFVPVCHSRMDNVDPFAFQLVPKFEIE